MLYEQFKYNLGIMAEHFANLLAVGISGIGLDYKKHSLAGHQCTVAYMQSLSNYCIITFSYCQHKLLKYFYINFTTEISLPSTIICTLYSQGLQCKIELRLSSLTVVKRTFCLHGACSEW